MGIDSFDDVLTENYSIVALHVFLQALADIRCYYLSRGLKEDRLEGRKAIQWIRRMQGSFPILIKCLTTMTVEEFHQMLLNEINDIKYGRHRVHQIYTPFKKDRMGNLQVV